MALNYSSILHIYCIFLILTILLYSSPVFSFENHNNPSDLTREVLREEKTRLGSTPPSCYNKCNQCHPCTAVQVPTLPSLSQKETTQMSQPPSSVAISEYNSYSGDNNRHAIMQRLFGGSVNIGECKEISIKENMKRGGCTIMEDRRS
ncbi:EPIDERMAL PATTERNING FACTOR-like protein 1 isoform X2 [Amaranthus tricolor]|uniref:EPIDERMAL PATTERNING FACTOR-like protein 1 isoform X2 n=1 Tax=Amaranthus tricolor TaxID=29722 RepID=UPI0025901B34|nr:EPIDERMAL PATTERNING FACTOR-like protein 1 isoform X2 [Amaranthus tricolor]